MDKVNSKNGLYIGELKSKHKQEKEELLLKMKVQKQYVDSGGGNTGGEGNTNIFAVLFSNCTVVKNELATGAMFAHCVAGSG